MDASTKEPGPDDQRAPQPAGPSAHVWRGILEIATRDCSRMDFLRDLAAYLRRESGAVEIELRFTDGGRTVRCIDGDALYVEVLPGRNLGTSRALPDQTVACEFEIGPSDHGAIAITQPAQMLDRAELARIIGAALAGRRHRDALAERVKELTCLQSLAEIFADLDGSLDEHLRVAVELLPASFELPDIASARIEVDGVEHCTARWTGGGWPLESQIKIAGERRGVVTVEYAREGDDLPTGEPFLAEEQTLLASVAHQIARLVEREEAARSQARLEEQVRHADRLAVIGQVAAGVAHELNRPLGSILGFAELATRSLTDDADPKDVARDLTKIIQASLHAREIVRKLLFFGRQMPVTTREVDISAVVEETRFMISPACRDAGIEAEWCVEPDLPPILCDPAELQQVVLNLAINAIQAMPTGGRLRIATLRAGTGVALEVEDTGSGMSAEVLEQVFLPFFTTKDVGEGTGLGLSVVHGIVGAHGGQIDIQSDPASGTRCRVVLPGASATAAPGSRAT